MATQQANYAGPGKIASAVLRFGTGVHALVYRLSGGRFGSSMGAKTPVLLLNTIGRKSGTLRTTPLVYLADGNRLVVVGSGGTATRHPAWVLNLLAEPSVQVQAGERRFEARARIAEGDERARLWQGLVAMFGRFEEMQAQQQPRELPVIVLEPSAEVTIDTPKQPV